MARSFFAFLWLMLRPGGRVVSVVSDLLGFAGTFYLAAIKDDPRCAAFVLLLFLLGLAVFAGIRLQHEKRVDFELVPDFDTAARSIDKNGVHSGNVELSVYVRNMGGASDFAAEIPRCELPVARLETGKSAGTLRVNSVAWDRTTAPTVSIVGEQKLRLGAVASSPPCFWWWVAENAATNPNSYGVGWRLVPQAQQIEFDLRVTRLDRNVSVVKRCRIGFDDNNQFVSFGFVET